MGYQAALEAAGATVVEFKEFGSYQGTWIAILDDGRIIEGAYGSCSGCDAFQSEFDWCESINEYNGKYYRDNCHWDEDELITKEEADMLNSAYYTRLKNFGASYLEEAQTIEQALSRYSVKASDEYAWQDDKDIYEWLKVRASEIRETPYEQI